MNDKLSYTLDGLATTLDESDFKSKMLGKAIKLQRLTDSDSIEFERLTDSNRAAIKFAVWQVMDDINTRNQMFKNYSMSSVTAPKGGRAQ